MSTIRPGLAGRRAQAVSRLLWLGVVTACAAAGAPLWRYYIGVQRIVTDDHERGVTWEPFVKHKHTWQYRFQNPAQPYLDAKELYDLTPAERADFRKFCEIRYGVSDLEQCYRIMCAYAAGATDGCRLYVPALPKAAHLVRQVVVFLANQICHI